jgi:hypothetical protein
LGAGFLSTLAALVIGLMIASAKNTYDTQNTNIRQLGTNAVLVDQMLPSTGRNAKAARSLLREIIPSATSRIWQENASGKGDGSAFVVSGHGERFYNAVEGLKPANAKQTSLKSGSSSSRRKWAGRGYWCSPRATTGSRCRSSSCWCSG